MSSLYGSRTRVAGYAGPQAEMERARKLGRDARAEQQRMDMIRAQHLRAAEKLRVRAVVRAKLVQAERARAAR